MEKEKEAARDATQEVADLLSWADTFDEANAETKHMIIARLVERIEINHDLYANCGISAGKKRTPTG